MARRQGFNAFEKSVFSQRVLEHEVLRQRAGMRFDLRQEWQQRLGFGGKIEYAVHYQIIERFDAEAIAGSEQRAILAIDQRKSEHAAQMRDTVCAVSIVCR